MSSNFEYFERCKAKDINKNIFIFLFYKVPTQHLCVLVHEQDLNKMSFDQSKYNM